LSTAMDCFRTYLHRKLNLKKGIHEHNE
jgi:hypothetical protein